MVTDDDVALFAGGREGVEVDIVEEDEVGGCEGADDGGSGGGGTEDEVTVDEGAELLAERGGLGWFIETWGINGIVWGGTVCDEDGWDGSISGNKGWDGSIWDEDVWVWVVIICCDLNIWDGSGWAGSLGKAKGISTGR